MKGETAVARILAERIGLDPSSVGGGQLMRALHVRMSELQLGSQSDYIQLLRESHAEQDALIEEVVVPESWFFRDDAPFRLFRDYVRTRWLSPTERGPLRVLSIPCAGGEEPYSLAIALRELGLPAERWSIDAVDVSRRSLDRAMRGVYGEHAFRAIDPEHRERYFRPHPGGHELDPTIRTSARFQRGNLLDPHLFQDAPPFDVILCRNLLIYLDPAARRRAIDTLDRLLVPSGLLFLGHAERTEIGDSRFEPVDAPECFAYVHVAPGSVPVGSRGPEATATTLKSPQKRAVSTPSPRVREGRGGGARRVATTHRPNPKLPPRGGSRPEKAERDDRSSLLVEAAALADRGETRDAAERCERFLRESGPSAPAYFLLGMLKQAEGDGRRAEEYLQKTIYLDPRHDEALLALALLADRRGDPIAAAGYRRRAERVHRWRETP
jgi:chemotaxis protein methyltransferase WspC